MPRVSKKRPSPAETAWRERPPRWPQAWQGYKICLKDDLVINTLWAWMGAMGVSPVDGIVSPAYNVYAPNERLEPAYADALVRYPSSRKR